MRRLLTAVALAGLQLFSQFTPNAKADEIDKLVDVLADKGVITPEEAQRVKHETKDKTMKDQAEGTSPGSPTWTQMIKLKGDFRARYQGERRSINDVNISRNRSRLRLRFGAEAKVNKKVKAYIGIASGGSDPRSTNQTFDNQFELKDIRLDFAYGEVAPNKNVTFWAGRMKNPIWEPGDMLWDTDINPEGVALRLNKKPSSQTEFFVATGAFSLDEFSGSNRADPWMFFMQPGLKRNLSEKWGVQLAGTYYNTAKVNQSLFVPDYGLGNNTIDPVTKIRKYNYDSFNISGEIGYRDPASTRLPFFALFSEYHYAFEPTRSNHGEVGGARIGYERVQEWKQWNFRYMYVFSGDDFWFDFTPDSDRYTGRSDVRGHEFLLQLGLSHNFRLDLDYYRIYSHRQPNNPDGNPEDLLQVDMNFIF